jgi:hypothetical protein
LEVPTLTFYQCQTFEQIEYFLAAVGRGEYPAPSFMALDVFCEAHPNFEMFGVDLEVDPNRCGYQLYEHILRPVSGRFQSAPVLFFTSFGAAVGDLSIRRLANTFGSDIRHCERLEFRSMFLNMAVEHGLLDLPTADSLRPVGLTQDEYVLLFNFYSAQFEFSDAEKCRFLGLQSGFIPEIPVLIRMSSALNERIDIQMAISVLVDRFVHETDKRKYLERLGSSQLGTRFVDLFVSGSVQNLLIVKQELEFRLGGAIL